MASYGDMLLERLGYGPNIITPDAIKQIANQLGQYVQSGQMTFDDAFVELRAQAEGRNVGTTKINPDTGQPYSNTYTEPTPTGDIAPTDTSSGTPQLSQIRSDLVKYGVYTLEEVSATYSDGTPVIGTDQLLADYKDAMAIGVIPRPTSAGGTGSGGAQFSPNSLALLNPEFIDLTSQGLPGRAILRGTDNIIDLRVPGQYKPIQGIPGVYADSVTGNIYDSNGTQLAKDQLALSAELGRGNLDVAQGNLALNQQGQAFDQNVKFPESVRQFNTTTTQGYDLAGDTNRRLAASDVLSNAVNLQGQQDQRGFAAARLAANPGDFVQREYVARGLAAPQQGQVPLFSTVPQVAQGFSSLQNYQPTKAPQLSGITAGQQPPAALPPQLPTRVETPTGPTTANPMVTPDYNSTDPNNPGGVTNPNSGTYVNDAWYNTPEAQQAVQTQDVNPGGAYGIMEQLQILQDEANRRMAYGGVTQAPSMIVGDPQRSGQPNPEIVTNPTGAPLSVTPMSQLVPKYAYGTTQSPYELSQVAANTTPRPIGGANYEPSSLNTLAPTLQARPVTGAPVAPANNLLAGNPQQVVQTNQVGPQPAGTYTQANPNPTVPINTDQSIQQLPTLQYLQGLTPQSAYGGLSTANAQGAFGTQLPEAGALNIYKISQIMNDPVAVQLLNSLYASGSRDFGAEVSRAKARAPIGNAPVSSLIRT